MPTANPGQIPLRPRPGRAAAAGLAQARRALLDLRVAQAEMNRTDIVPVSRDRMLPLSSAQQRLWFLDQWMSGTSVYNAPLMLRIRGPVDTTALARALTTVVRRHEVLRTRYETDRGVPYQVIDPAPELVELPVIDLTAEQVPPGQRQQRSIEHLTDMARKPFDLECGPLLRAMLIRLDSEDHGLGVCIHHIATDGWSSGILLRELIAGYQAASTGAGTDLPALDVQYADYAVWQREQLSPSALDRQLSYWRASLADLPVLDFPADHPRPSEPTFRGQSLTVDLPGELQAGVTELARREQATLLAVLLAGFTALLARYTGQEDIVVGSIFSGRTRPAIEPLIGFFANTLVLRTSTAGNPTFRELLGRAAKTVLGAHLNQDVNFSTLVEELSPDRDPSRNPLFQVCFSLQEATAGQGEIAGLSITPEAVEMGTSRFDLAVHVTEVAGHGLQLWMEFSTELFDPDRMRRLPDQFALVLGQVVADPDVRLGDLDLLTAEERAATLEQAVAPVRFGKGDRCLQELFEEQAAKAPEAVACRFLGTSTSYGELNLWANRLARLLRARQPAVGPEAVVGVLLDRGPALPASLLAVLKAGAAYLPLDPQYPADRIAYAVRDSGCALVLTSGRFAGLLPPDAPFIAVDHPGTVTDLAELPGTDLPPLAVPGNAAYLIYTSGSTGRPKGVVVEHSQIVNFTRAVTGMFRLGPGDRLLQFANPAFDTSAFDFYGALANGAVLVQAPTATLHNPATLTMLMREERVTVTDLPPTVLAELTPADLHALRALFVGMEPFPAELVNRWNEPGRREFHNGYGPTEATVACIDYLCPDGTLEGAPPIGLPMANYSAYLIDKFAALAPAGLTAELYVGGAGIARGYHGQPGLTAERFVPSPFGPPGGRLYRTGDLARRDGDGILVFAGRADSQIKIRGMRIEPGEIEAALLEHPLVQQAIVVARTDGGATRLAAYLIPEHGQAPAPDALRGHLADRLPPFMIPTAFMSLSAFPKNVNGKVDRARLPAPDDVALDAARTAPRTAAEGELAGIWRDVLGHAELGVDDNFFAIGGSSLKFAQVAARVKDAFRMSLGLRELFANPTIADLARLVASQGLAGDGEPTEPAEPAGPDSGDAAPGH